MSGVKYFALAVGICLSLASVAAGQQPLRRPTSIPDLFNQEAAASDPEGIHKYSEDLVGLILPSGSEKADTESLSDRLARAEITARAGRGKLVPEPDIVRAFNELMAKIGAPPALKADEDSMRRFREHGASIKAFPALLSANRNGVNCNPGEAVFLFYLLVFNDGKLSERLLDSASARTQLDNRRNEGGQSFGVAHTEVLNSGAGGVLSSYLSHHNRSATMALFDNLARILGF